MSRPTLLATVFIIAVVAIAGATVMDANSLRPATTTQVSVSIDVMQMMKNAKNLPEEQYDAH